MRADRKIVDFSDGLARCAGVTTRWIRSPSPTWMMWAYGGRNLFILPSSFRTQRAAKQACMSNEWILMNSWMHEWKNMHLESRHIELLFNPLGHTSLCCHSFYPVSPLATNSNLKNTDQTPNFFMRLIHHFSIVMTTLYLSLKYNHVLSLRWKLNIFELNSYRLGLKCSKNHKKIL